MTFIHDVHFSLAIKHVLHMQGIRDVSAFPDKVMALSKELLDTVNRLCLLEPAIAYDFFPVLRTEHDHIFLKGGMLLKGGLLSKRLGRASEMAVIICTIGPHLEKKVTDYFNRGDPLRAILLDGIGSPAVDTLSQEACRVILN
jgi:hypothetical protein